MVHSGKLGYKDTAVLVNPQTVNLDALDIIKTRTVIILALMGMSKKEQVVKTK